MASKKDMLEGYFNERDLKNIIPSTKKQTYTKNKVFDQPNLSSLNKNGKIEGNSDVKLSTGLETNLRQSGDKLETNLRQSGDKLETNLRQSGDKLRTELRTEPETNLRQSGDKLETNIVTPYSFYSLVGTQRELAIFLYRQCKINRDKTTPPISMDNIAMSCNISISSARKTLQRLEKKNLVKRSSFKNGRGGWTKYELPKDIYQEIFNCENYDQLKTNLRQSGDKLETNLRQSGDKLRTELRTELRTSTPSSSSYINKTTTNLPEEWLCINFEPVADIGFSANHLQQLFDKNSPEVVQESIFHFAYSLIHNSKFKNHENPLNLFMGVLRKGNAWIEPNYRSAQEMALAQILELKAAEQARIKQLEDDAYKMAFEEWKGTLSQDELERIAPKSKSSLAKGGLPERLLLNQFFKETIWPEARKEFKV